MKRLIEYIVKEPCKAFVFAVITGLMLLTILGGYYTRIVPVSTNGVAEIRQDKNDVMVSLLEEGDVVRQTFSSQGEKITSFGIEFFVDDNEKGGKVNIQLQNTKSKDIYFDQILTFQDLNGKIQLDLGKNGISKAKGNEYEIIITLVKSGENNTISLKTSEKDTFGKGELYINGEKKEGDLSFFVRGAYPTSLRWYYAAIVVLALLGILITAFLLYKKNAKIEKIFLVTCLFWGMLYILLFPPNSAPDETIHITSTQYYAGKYSFQEKLIDENGKILAREEDRVLLDIGEAVDLDTYQKVYSNLFKLSDKNNIVPLTTRKTGNTISYLPQIIGVTLARALNLGGMMTLYMGKLFALLFFALCTFYSIKILPFGKNILYTLALCPMMLELFTSFSYDMMTCALSFLFISLTMFFAYEKKEVGWKEYLLLCILAIAMAQCKAIYILICFLVLIIPRKTSLKRKNYYIGILGVIVCGVLSMLVTYLPAVMSIAINPMKDTAVGAVETYTLNYLLFNLKSTVGLLFETFITKGDFYLFSTFGYSLGWFNLNIPMFLIVAFIVIIILSALCHEEGARNIKSTHKVWMGLISLGVIGASVLTMVLAWTPLGNGVIEGVQGRYFLPVIPLILLMVRNNSMVIKKNLEKGLILSVSVLQFFCVIMIFLTAISK